MAENLGQISLWLKLGRAGGIDTHLFRCSMPLSPPPPAVLPLLAFIVKCHEVVQCMTVYIETLIYDDNYGDNDDDN